MSLITQFKPPIEEFPTTSKFYETWHQFITRVTPGPRILPVTVSDPAGGGYYDPTTTKVKVLAHKVIPWMAFPRDLILPNNRDNKESAYKMADSNRKKEDHPQNEYCEWRIEKSGNKISKVTFTTEVVEYYRALWEYDKKMVAKLYNKILGLTQVTVNDLALSNGEYNKFNKWNTTEGIVHLNHSINTLYAATNLAANTFIHPGHSPENNFTAQPGYYNVKTSVDPRVDYDTTMLMRQQLYLTMAEPLGVYIFAVDNAGLTRPDGSPAPKKWWKTVRGKEGMGLRMEYEVPASEGYVVGDMKIGGKPIRYGGQLAELITVGIIGAAGVKV